MLKKIGARPWLTAATLLWGIVMTLTGTVNNGTQLIVMRILLGITESPLFPGLSTMLAFLYPRSCIAFRIGVFFSFATVAGAFGGLIAYGVEGVSTFLLRAERASHWY